MLQQFSSSMQLGNLSNAVLIFFYHVLFGHHYIYTLNVCISSYMWVCLYQIVESIKKRNQNKVWVKYTQIQ